ncbi:MULTISPECIES: flippase-like domain-containing protein [unclassified Isoptericola]|uniref:flippase-like domain-containing protein n=1 Tax=unclassified Isoptericola TaxID=2623355 RepID=UPI00365DC3BA
MSGASTAGPVQDPSHRDRPSHRGPASDPTPPTGPLQALLGGDGSDDGAPTDLVRVVDTPEARVRHPSDMLGMVVSALGVALVLVLSVVAHATTEGVTEDVQNFSTLLARILFVPVQLLEGLVTLFVPAAVLIELGWRRLGRQVVESICAAALGLVLGVVTALTISRFGSDELVRGLSVFRDGTWQLTIPGYVAAIAGLLTTAGPRTRRRTVRWSWNVLYLSLAIVLITGQVSLPGVIVALLLGRLAGQAVQYVSGVRSERAYGADLVAAVRRAGFHPTALVRVRDVSVVVDDDAPGEVPAPPEDPVAAYDADGDVVEEPPDEGQALPAPPTTADAAAVALTRAGDNRVYALLTDDGAPRRDVVVLDGDRQVMTTVQRLWRALRLRGLEGRASISLRAAAERTALLAYAATAAGVRTQRLEGIGVADDSVVLVQEHARGAVSLRDVAADDLEGARGDAVLAEAWEQLRRAHDAGLTHHSLTLDVVLVHHDERGAPHVWLTGWEQGEIASGTLSRRLDLTQMLALLALRVGARRALASAVRALPDKEIAAIGPLLQSVALPSPTREEVRKAKGLLDELREALVERLPQADVQPQNITRFGARTIIMLTLTIVAVTVIVTTMNFEEIASAITEANPWWVAASFAFGAITWFGAALTFSAFSPEKLPLWRATLTQMAGSFVSLAAPAGIGPAALNLRMLTRRGVATPMAVATVALVQLSQFVVTVLLLVVLSVSTGSGGLIDLPSTTVLLAIAGVGVAVVATLLVPSVRRWAWEKARPTLEQVWPRLSQMIGQPTRLALGLGGNVIMTLGYVLAFDAALAAFGQELNLIDVAVIYLVGNSVGAMVPTPGGLGGVEGALIAGLTAAGIPASLAFSVTMLYRVVTYWARVPIGWVAMKRLESTGDL